MCLINPLTKESLLSSCNLCKEAVMDALRCKHSFCLKKRLKCSFLNLVLVWICSHLFATSSSWWQVDLWSRLIECRASSFTRHSQGCALKQKCSDSQKLLIAWSLFSFFSFSCSTNEFHSSWNKQQSINHEFWIGYINWNYLMSWDCYTTYLLTSIQGETQILECVDHFWDDI